MAAADDFATYMAAAATAFAGSDFKTARRQIVLARMAFVQMPNVSDDGTSVAYRADELDKLQAAIEAESKQTSPSATSHCEFAGE